MMQEVTLLESFIPVLLIKGNSTVILLERYSINAISDINQGLPILISLLFLTFPYYYLILLPIHECGHLIFGLLSGYRFFSFRIGKLQLIKRGNSLRICKEWNPISDGQCLMSPPLYKDKSHPYILYMMGGAILDALLMFVLVIVSQLTRFPNTALQWVVLYLAALEFLSVLANVVPIKLYGVNNDAMITVLMGKDVLAIKSWYAYAHIRQGYMEGKTVSELSQFYFVLPCQVDYNNDLITYYLLELFQYYVQTEKWEELKCCIEQTEQAQIRWDRELKAKWKKAKDECEQYRSRRPQV